MFKEVNYTCNFCGTDNSFIDNEDCWSKWSSKTYCDNCGHHYTVDLNDFIYKKNGEEYIHISGKSELGGGTYKRVGKYFKKV
jgi:hypothetical protein